MLAALTEAYEARQHPIPTARQLDVLLMVMEQKGLRQADPAAVLGSRSHVSDVLSGKRSLTIGMIRTLRDDWGIPADALIGDRPADRKAAIAGRRTRVGPRIAGTVVGHATGAAIRKPASVAPGPRR